MDRFDRRSALRAIGIGLGASVTGCIADGVPGSGTDPPNTPLAVDRISHESVDLGTSLDRRGWRGDDGDPGYLEVYATEPGALGAIDLDGLADDRRAAVEAFVAETDFDAQRLLSVGSMGPDTCHDSIALSGLSVDDDTLVGAARVEDSSDASQGCGDAITYPAALARVSFEGPPRDRARISVTDGWEETTDREATAIARDPGELAGHVAPEGDPPSIPEGLTCNEQGFARHGTGYEEGPARGLSSSGWGAFAMRVDSRTVSRGESVTVTMTNVGTGEAYTGNRHKYNLQVWTEAGWQDVRGSPDGDPLGYTDEAYSHEPGEGFEWTLEMTPKGVLSGHVHEDRLSVCPGLPAGRYRFAFWEPALAVAFDLVA